MINARIKYKSNHAFKINNDQNYLSEVTSPPFPLQKY